MQQNLIGWELWIVIHSGGDLAKKYTQGLYDPSFERDSCGFGLIANIDNKPNHQIIDTAIESLKRLTHRGAISVDGKSGDGCGVLLKLPKSFFSEIARTLNITLSEKYAVGNIFLNIDLQKREKTKSIIQSCIEKEGLTLSGWREVPVNESACGEVAKNTLPFVEQIFVSCKDEMSSGAFNRKLFLARKRAEQELTQVDECSYILSLSSETINYKGMVMPEALPEFFLDLKNKNMETSACVFHQRFSTNTLPEWRLAQPFRYLAHNGEINTIQGNRFGLKQEKNIFSRIY